MGGFDPYLIWLDIPPHERPVNHYRLLGLRLLENDQQTISAAADRVIAHVSQFQNSPQSDSCRRLLAEIHAARACLLDASRKAAYDRGLSGGAAEERPLSGPPSSVVPPSGSPVTGNPPGQAERPLPDAPRISPGPGERQIAQSPPVPSAPPTAASSGASTPQRPMPLPQSASPTVPQSPPSEAIPGGEVSLPQSALPGAPTHPGSEVPAASPVAHPQPVSQPQPGTPEPPNPPPPNAPPAWATGNTGQVSTVTPGQSPEQISTEKSSRGRVLRRQQQAQSAYLLVAFALAMIVFFFGAVLLLAIYLVKQ